MQSPPLPANESARLAALSRYNILDTPAEQGFDRLTALAAQVFTVPVAIITLIDNKRQWFKSAYGTNLKETPREIAFCAYTILDNTPLIVPDATLDPRFKDNPFVTGHKPVRFYAGVPLTTTDGYNLGALCLLDYQPRQFSADATQTLCQLAELVMAQLEERQNYYRLLQTEASLKERDQILSGVFHAFSAHMVVLDSAGVIRYVSGSWERFASENGGDLRQCGVGVNYLAVCERAARLDAAVLDILAGIKAVLQGELVTYVLEYQLNVATGNYSFVMVVDPMPSELGGVIITHANITAKKQAEEQATRSAQLFQALIEHSSEMITMTGRNGEVLYQSPAVARQMGYTEAELRGQNSFEFVHPDDVSMLINQHKELIAHPGMLHRNEFRFRHKDGSWHYMETVAQNLLEQPGIQAIIVNGHDVTERKKVEIALRQSEERLNFALSAANVGIWEYDILAGRVYWSEQVAPLLGFAPGGFDGTFESIVAMALPEDRAKLLSTVQQTLDKGTEYQIEYRIIRPDGKIQWLEGKGRPYFDEHGQAVRLSGIVQDITERKQTEAALVESEARFAAFMEHSPAAAFILDDAANFVYVNKAYRQIFEIDVDLVGRNCSELFPPEIDAHHRAHDRQVLENQAVLEEAESWQRKDGSTGHWLGYKFPMHDTNGRRLVGGVGIDITPSKRAEEALARSEAQLRQSQKMEAVGRLAGGIAHDFNNLLTAITGYCDLILLDLKEQDALYQDVSEIQQAANRASNLTRQLLAFSRQQVMQPTTLDLNEVVSEMHRLLRRLIGENIDLLLLPDDGVDYVKADRGQLEQIIVNLAVNARDAMPQGGKLIFETANVELDEGYVLYHPDVKPGRYVRLAVSDTGCGMNETIRSRIFEPFFTTKERGQGTGLGLSTVYGIVKQSGGYIEVYSEEAVGSSFKIYFPSINRSDTVKTSQSNRSKNTSSWHSLRHETVLVVEDEEGVRNLAARVLEQYGYNVILAANSNEALSVAAQNPGQLDLMLTDVVLPKLSGPVLAQRLTALQPDLKVLYMSGYTDGLLAENMEAFAEGELNQRLLQKPFTPQVLVQKVRQVLDSSKYQS